MFGGNFGLELREGGASSARQPGHARRARGIGQAPDRARVPGSPSDLTRTLAEGHFI